LAIFDVSVYDWPFLHVCNLQENLLFFTLIYGSVFSNYVVFYWDISFVRLSAIRVQILLTLPGMCFMIKI